MWCDRKEVAEKTRHQCECIDCKTKWTYEVFSHLDASKVTFGRCHECAQKRHQRLLRGEILERRKDAVWYVRGGLLH